MFQEVKSMYPFRDLEVRQQTFRLRTPETCGGITLRGNK